MHSFLALKTPVASCNQVTTTTKVCLHAEKWSKDGLHKNCQGIKEKWSKPPQGFREGFSEAVAHEKKAGIFQLDKVDYRTFQQRQGCGKRTETPVLQVGICLWACEQGRQMRMEKRFQVCGWGPADPAYHIKSIRVEQGWGQEEGCQGLQPSGVEGSAWREGVSRASPGTPACDSLLALGAPAYAEKPGAAMGSGWEARPRTGQGSLPALFFTQRLGQAAGEPCWGPQIPSDRGESKEACQSRLTEDRGRLTATRWGNWVLVKEGTCWSHTVRCEQNMQLDSDLPTCNLVFHGVSFCPMRSEETNSHKSSDFRFFRFAEWSSPEVSKLAYRPNPAMTLSLFLPLFHFIYFILILFSLIHGHFFFHWF